MGHAAHFLRRLDRLSDPHVELALTLYNDPQLLGATLKRAKLPEGAERVAITLDDPELGPFLVVTREGRFVTCLGRGMRVSGTPIITREQLDAAAHRVERMREAIAQSRHLGANQGLFRKQVAPLYKDAEWVSREQLEDIARWEPLLGTVFAAECVHLATQLMDTRRRVKNILRPHARHKRLLSSYHRILHSLGHLYVLTAISPTGRELLLEAMRPHEEMTWAWAGLRHDVSYVLYRALWSAGKVGKPLLPALKRRLRGQLTYLGTADGILGAAMIGLAHDKVRAEVRKVLASPRASVPEDDELIPAFDKLLMSSLDVCFDFPDTCETLFVGGAREMLFEKTPLREEYGWERPEDIPSELCYGAMLQVPRPLLHHVESLAGSLFVLPWLARAEASQLYLPQRFIDLVRHPWTMEQTIALLESQRQEEGVRRPVKNEKTGRNDPCPCGSGKKYKRCCALKPSAPDE